MVRRDIGGRRVIFKVSVISRVGVGAMMETKREKKLVYLIDRV